MATGTERSGSPSAARSGTRSAVLAWLATAVALTIYFIVAHMAAFRGGDRDAAGIAVVAVTDVLSWVVMAGIGLSLARAAALRTLPWTITLPGLLLAALVAIVIRLVIFEQLGHWLGWEYPLTLGRRVLHFLPEHSLFVLIFVGAGMAFRATADAAAVQRRVTDLRLEIAESNFRRLRSGLRPRVLFGSLTSIMLDIGRSPRDAIVSIARLGDLLRYSMRSARRDAVPLREEVEQLRKYVEAVRTVLDRDLSVTAELEAGTEDASIEPMLLLHLVDGWVGDEGAATLTLHAYRDGEGVALSISVSAGDEVLRRVADTQLHQRFRPGTRVRTDRDRSGALTLLLDPHAPASAPLTEPRLRVPHSVVPERHPRALGIIDLVLAVMVVFFLTAAVRDHLSQRPELVGAARAAAIAMRAASETLVWAALFVFLFAVLRAVQGRRRRAVRVAWGILAVVAGTVIFTGARYVSLCMIAPPRPCPPARFLLLHQSPFVAIFASAFVGIGIGIISSRRDLAAAHHAILLRADAVEARVRSLNSQLQPHFLFNALNSVASLVGSDPPAAKRMLQGLEELLELSLHRSGEVEISLEQELEFVTTYLAIESLRFPDRLQVEIEVPPELRSARVPFMLLQPLVENAIHHAVARSDRAGRIEISARASGTRLELSVRDNGSPAQIRSGSGEGIGWSNTRDRLRELYGPEHRFSVEGSEQSGLEITIALPLTGAGEAQPQPEPVFA